MSEIMTVNDAFPRWKQDEGFFNFLWYWANENHSPPIEIPWIHTEQIAHNLDLEYHGNHSGDKPISRLLEKFAVDLAEIGDAYRIRFAEIFYNFFSETINKEYAVLSAEYNPIQNYDMTESGTDTHTGDDTLTKSGNQTRAMTGGRKTTTTITDSVQGFDSNTYTPSTKTETTDETIYSVGASPETETTTYNNVRDKTEYNTETGHALTRSGNIGVTTSQQMLQSEIDLWKWNFYNDILFPAVDKVLTSPLYF